MPLQDIIGELVRQNMASQTQTRMRAGAGAAAGGMEALRDALMGRGAGASPARTSGGGLEDLLGSILGGAGAPARRSGPAGAGQASHPRDAAFGERGASGGGGLEDLLGAVLGGASQPRSGGAGGGVGDLLGAILGGGQSARGGGGQAGGAMGDLLGAVLGGSRGAAGGGAMAILASLAMGALRSYMTQGGTSAAAAVSPEEARSLVSPRAERAILMAMLSAAKADGKLDHREIGKITAKAAEGGATPEEKAFLDAELAKPIDLGALAAQAQSPALAAQVYAASVLAIDIDTAAEVAYLRDLATALRLPQEAVAEIHRMTGAPEI